MSLSRFISILRLSCLIVTISLLPAVDGINARADAFDKALSVYRSKDYATALSLFRPLAAEGDARAQSHLGFMYEFGQGVEQDPAQAIAWLRKASEQEEVMALYGLSYAYAQGHGVPQDFVQAFRWFRNAAILETAGRGKDESDEELIRRPSDQLHRDAHEGDANAQLKLGSYYLYQITYYSASYELDRTFGLFLLAALQGQERARYQLLTMYRNGKPAHWFNKAAAHGDADSQFRLALTFPLIGYDQETDPRVAEWLEKAAEQGHTRAQYRLGALYNSGHGVPQSFSTAYKWIKSAADQGHVLAQRDLAVMYLSGTRVTQNSTEARKLYDKVAAIEASESSPSPLLDARPTGSQYVRIARSLKALGYDTNRFEDTLGPRMRAAIRAFQTRVGLPPTGDTSPQLVAALKEAVESSLGE